MSGGGPSDVRLTASHMRGGSAGKGDGGGFSLRRSGSQGSLNSLVSIMDQLTGEQHLRVCKHCHQRVSARNRAVQQRQQQPLLSLLYTKLMTDRATLERLLPRYINMAQSLWSGESVYNLSDAAELRMKLLRLGDSINATSQKIKTLGPVLTQEQQELETPDGKFLLGHYNFKFWKCLAILSKISWTNCTSVPSPSSTCGEAKDTGQENFLFESQ